MKKATQNTALPKMKLILSQKGRIKQDGKILICHSRRVQHRHIISLYRHGKKGKRRKREKRKKGATEIAPFAVATKTRRFPLLVEVTGLEPTTSWSRTKRATKLRYTS